MATHDIPRENWQEYFDEFTCKHKGATMKVETVDNHSAPQISKPHPLVGISYSPANVEPDAITIEFAGGANQIVTRKIQSPKHVYHKTGAGIISDEVNAHEVIEITAESHPAITQLQFRPRP